MSLAILAASSLLISAASRQESSAEAFTAVERLLVNNFSELPPEERSRHLAALKTAVATAQLKESQIAEWLSYVSRLINQYESTASVAATTASSLDHSLRKRNLLDAPAPMLPAEIRMREASSYLEYVSARAEEYFTAPLPTKEAREALRPQMDEIFGAVREAALTRIAGANAVALIDRRMKELSDDWGRQSNTLRRGMMYRAFTPEEMAEITRSIMLKAGEISITEASSPADAAYAGGEEGLAACTSPALSAFDELLTSYYSISVFQFPKSSRAWRRYVEARREIQKWWSDTHSDLTSRAKLAQPERLPRPGPTAAPAVAEPEAGPVGPASDTSTAESRGVNQPTAKAYRTIVAFMLLLVVTLLVGLRALRGR